MAETFWCFTVACNLLSEETLAVSAGCTVNNYRSEKSYCPQLSFIIPPRSAHVPLVQPPAQTGRISTNCSFSPSAPARHMQAAPRNSSTCGSDGADPSGSRAARGTWEQCEPISTAGSRHRHQPTASPQGPKYPYGQAK